MHTFIKKQRPAQDSKSAISAKPGRALSDVVLQRPIENHALEQLPRDDAHNKALPQFAHDFSRVPVRAIIQPKLMIGAPGDMHEQQADRLAEKVMHMPEPQLHRMGVERPNLQAEQAAPDHTQSNHIQENGSEEIMTSPLVHRALGSSGQPLDATTRAFMEPRFGHDFSRVRVHTNALADEASRSIRARAFTYDQNIAFRQGEYDPVSTKGKHLLAHELAHTLQQGMGQVQRKVQRAVDTFGGTFDTTKYVSYSKNEIIEGHTVRVVGAEIDLSFTPNNLVEADKIGLSQTVKTSKSLVAGGAVNTPSYTDSINQKLSLTQGDKGRAIDKTSQHIKYFGKGSKGQDSTAGTGIPQTSPLYQSDNFREVVKNLMTGKLSLTFAKDSVSKTLGDLPPRPSDRSKPVDPLTRRDPYGVFGSHKKNKDKTFAPPVAATLGDRPKRGIEFPGQMYEHKFEVAALALDGPMKNIYLGSIGWGWKSDATGSVTLDPDPIRLISMGAPTKDFMDAAELWNKSVFTDLKIPNKTYPSVDLPITTVSAQPKSPASMKLPEIVKAIDRINDDLNTPTTQKDVKDKKGKGDDHKPYKELEKAALEEELKSRKIAVNVEVKSTEDWMGADEVYVKATSGSGKTATTKTHSINTGKSHIFEIALSEFLPLDKEITIEVYDADSGDKKTKDPDDLIVVMGWKYPFVEEIVNGTSRDGAFYRVRLTTQR